MNWLESTQITGGKRFYVLEEHPPESVKRLSAISIEKDNQGNWQGYVLTADRGFVALPVQADKETAMQVGEQMYAKNWTFAQWDDYFKRSMFAEN